MWGEREFEKWKIEAGGRRRKTGGEGMSKHGSAERGRADERDGEDASDPFLG